MTLKTEEEKKRGYSDATHELIQRTIFANFMKYRLHKEEIVEKLKEAYSVAGLPMPEVIFAKDIEDEQFLMSAWESSVASAAWESSAAGATWESSTPRAARAVRAASAAWESSAAWVAWESSTPSTPRAARAAVDYYFNHFIEEHEYLQHEEGNENDRKALKLYTLFLELKELGMGYFSEKGGKLYVVPNPIIGVDEKNRFHSLTEPAVYWKGGLELYFIHGVRFEKKLWNQVKDKKLSCKEIVKLGNIEQRYIALLFYGAERLLKEMKAELVSKTKRNELYSMPNLIPGKEVRMLKYQCPSTKREYVKFVPETIDDADEAQAWSFSIEKNEYEILEVES